MMRGNTDNSDVKKVIVQEHSRTAIISAQEAPPIRGYMNTTFFIYFLYV